MWTLINASAKTNKESTPGAHRCGSEIIRRVMGVGEDGGSEIFTKLGRYSTTVNPTKQRFVSKRSLMILLNKLVIVFND